METLALRKVELGSVDYQKTLVLRRVVLLDPFDIPLLEACRDDESAVHWAAFHGESCVGCLLLIDRGGGTWQLRQMAVAPHLQRGGIGRRLALAAVEGAREAGGALLMAHAREPAVPFYEAVGFVTCGDPFVQVGLPHRHVVLTLATHA
jgi:GNAT superfamily N-acetyltransferase